ncbi:MAG: hypothetical protein OXP66_08585 [Candidatus Tectomicrobia bacterium]|nr:hypothetical protein [Candidatus Tectomicrobia bacterium]
MPVRNAVFIFFFIAGILLVLVPASAAQDNVLEREDIKKTQSEFDSILSDMRHAATTAERVLANVKTMDVESQRTATNSLFDGLKVKVNEMLEGLAPNSVLMDNLEGAKARVIVFKRWFERQPSDYPQRDQLIMRLEATIQSYDELTDQILAGRQQAQNALRELLRAQFYRSMEQMVESAEHSVDVTKRLVVSLQTLSNKVRQLAEEEMPEQTIPN